MAAGVNTHTRLSKTSGRDSAPARSIQELADHRNLATTQCDIHVSQGATEIGN